MKTIITVNQILICVFACVMFSAGAMAAPQGVEAEPVGKVEISHVDINHASADQLAQLKQVGPKKAQEIVRFREANGPFKSVDDLVLVKGIGKATIEKNRNQLLAGQ